MKHILTKLFIGIIFINLSCSGDDSAGDATEVPLGTDLPPHFTFDEKAYHGQSRLVVDYNQHFNHRNFVFYMVDTENYTWEKDPTEAKFELVLDVYSPGPDKFRSGVFDFVEIDMGDSGEAVEGKHFFNYATMQIDSNGDGKLTDTDPIYQAVDGSITIIKEEDSHTYTISLDLMMNNEQKITGEFTEDWTYFN